ncbi:Succinate-semialdehyde dehydrogenase [Mactra antiquata]
MFGIVRAPSYTVKIAISTSFTRWKSSIASAPTTVNHKHDNVPATLKQTMLSTSSLFKDKAYINGRWTTSKSGESFEVFNPSNGTVVTSVPRMNSEDTKVSIDTAYEAFQSWKSTTAKGKPLNDSRAEIEYSASFCEWFAEEARRIQGSIVSSPDKNKKIFTLKQPAGVCGMITPWNFPNVMITRKACAALAAGCTVVIKPSEETPLSALAMCEIFERAGFPPGVVNVITSDRTHASEVGKILCESPLVSHISFTGSSHVGKILLAQSSSTVKKCSMELGGNAPFIVFNSANINAVVNGAMASKFRNTGQTCLCANRFLIQEEIYDLFIDKMTETMKEVLITDDGFAPGATQGPLINQKAVEKIEELVQDAVNKGAKLVLGGKKGPQGGNFYESTLIKDITTDMRVFNEEIFGPVVAVKKFTTEEEAIKLAHQTRAGLASYVYTQDPVQQWRVAEELEYGIVGINEGLFNAAEAPFGGYKESGLGREGGVGYGIDEYLEVKYLAMGGMR